MRSTGSILLVLALCAGAVPSGAQSTSPPPARFTPLSAEEELKQLELQYATVRSQVDRAREKFQAGLATQEDLLQYQAQAEQLQVRLEAVRRRVAENERRELLRRPVDVRLKDATVRQAAAALSQASRLRIVVDEAIPADLRLSVEAQGVPLATVLETIAEQATFQIAPDADRYELITLKPWPTLLVNNERRVLMDRNAPWSREWGTPPTEEASRSRGYSSSRSNPFSAGRAVVGSAPLTADPTSVVPGAPSPAPGMASPGGMTLGSEFAALTFSISPAGNSAVVVAEPGVSGQGTPGCWLTVYRMDGGYQLRRVSTLFHVLGGQGAKGQLGAYPGMPGAPAPGYRGGHGGMPGAAGGPGSPGVPGPAPPNPALTPPAGTPVPTPVTPAPTAPQLKKPSVRPRGR